MFIWGMRSDQRACHTHCPSCGLAHRWRPVLLVSCRRFCPHYLAGVPGELLAREQPMLQQEVFVVLLLEQSAILQDDWPERDKKQEEIMQFLRQIACRQPARTVIELTAAATLALVLTIAQRKGRPLS